MSCLFIRCLSCLDDEEKEHGETKRNIPTAVPPTHLVRYQTKVFCQVNDGWVQVCTASLHYYNSIVLSVL